MLEKDVIVVLERNIKINNHIVNELLTLKRLILDHEILLFRYIKKNYYKHLNFISTSPNKEDYMDNYNHTYDLDIFESTYYFLKNKCMEIIMRSRNKLNLRDDKYNEIKTVNGKVQISFYIDSVYICIKENEIINKKKSCIIYKNGKSSNYLQQKTNYDESDFFTISFPNINMEGYQDFQEYFHKENEDYKKYINVMYKEDHQNKFHYVRFELLYSPHSKIIKPYFQEHKEKMKNVNNELLFSPDLPFFLEKISDITKKIMFNI